MIPEYKLYHGAALAELVHKMTAAISINELNESGRLSSYVFNECVGAQIKHSTQRLSPWAFTFTKANMTELLALRDRLDDVYVVFVCESQGFVCLSITEMLTIIDIGGSDQTWIRIERRRGKLFRVHGAQGELSSKKPNSLDLLVRRLSEPLPNDT